MKKPFFAGALIALCLPWAAFASTSSMHEFTLDNGLKVIVREDHRAATVISQLWYRVGSSYESPGQSGLSHALEHMVFKGSSKLCPNESIQIFQSLGVADNAFTQEDSTTYHQSHAPEHLGVALEVMADQMSTASLLASRWAGEREIIKSERGERATNDPGTVPFERLHSIAFASSGYGTPVIGWTHDIERIQTAELQQWYRHWYAPNNATLVIAGDVDIEHVKALTNRYFGPIARRELPAIKTPTEPEAPGERSITQYISHQAPNLIMAFNVPSLSTQSDPRAAYSLLLLNELLGGSSSALLKKQLVRSEELLIGVLSNYKMVSRGDALLTVTTTLNPAKTKSPSEVKERILALIETLKTAPPSPDDLERARTRIISQQVFARDDMQQYAIYLAELDMAGLSWKQDAERLQALKAITPADIQHAARTFLTRDRLAVSYVLTKEAHHE